MKLMKINVNTITIGLIVGGMILSSSLYVKAFCPTPMPPPTTGAWHIVHKNSEERREQDQLNKLLNERIEQGKMIEITADKDVKLLIKRRKAVDITVNNKELSLTECILDGIGIIMFCCLPFLALIIIERLG